MPFMHHFGLNSLERDFLSYSTSTISDSTPSSQIRENSRKPKSLSFSGIKEEEESALPLKGQRVWSPVGGLSSGASI